MASKTKTEDAPAEFESTDEVADTEDQVEEPDLDVIEDEILATDDEVDDDWVDSDEEDEEEKDGADGDEGDGEEGDEQAEDLDELESEELEMLTEDELAETLVVDEAAELRAIRRAELAMTDETGSERSEDEFLCQGCFLVLKSSQLADKRRKLCADCAG